MSNIKPFKASQEVENERSARAVLARLRTSWIREDLEEAMTVADERAVAELQEVPRLEPTVEQLQQEFEEWQQQWARMAQKMQTRSLSAEQTESP